MPLRSGAFRTSLSPFGSGMLPPYQEASDYTVVQPPGGDTTPPRPGPAPSPGGAPPGRGGGIPHVTHVAVRHIPKVGVQATGTAYGRGVQAVGTAVTRRRAEATRLQKAKGVGGTGGVL